MIPVDEIPLGPDFTKRPVGYLDDWRPYKSTQVLLSRVQDVLAEYQAHLPLTVRQIYYRLVASGNYKKGTKFEAKLSDALVNARRAGEIPFSSIRDDGIMGGGFWYHSVEQFRRDLRWQAKNYRRDLQAGQPARVQVWCEAAGMIPQLTKVCDEYSIPVYSCGGFNSLTAIRQIVDSCVEDTDGATVLLHLGDYDPSGEAIFERVQADVSAFLEVDAVYEEQLSFQAERVAITREQIDKFDLPMDPITTNDTRSKKWKAQGRTRKCELEALAPDQIAHFLKKAIEQHTDGAARDVALRRQVRERAVVWIPEPKSGPNGIWDPASLLERIRSSNNGGGKA